MGEKVRWGVLGAANIARKKVIPAMQRGTWTEVIAIASRDRTRAERAARELGIPKAYGSYEELLADPAVEAVYNPLPNHLHVPWSVKAAAAGKHGGSKMTAIAEAVRAILVILLPPSCRFAGTLFVNNYSALRLPLWLAESDAATDS